MMLSCSLLENNEEERVIARVEKTYLYHSDIEGVVPKGVSKEDSVMIINNYIQNWIKENLILQKAELNLKDNQKDFQKQLEDYRKTLIIYSYEKELIRQKLDTNVTKEEIISFYDNNKQNFELRDDILKVRYLKVVKNAPQLKKIRKVYKSTKPEDIEKLKEYAHQFSEKFFLNENQWILFDDLLQEVPLSVNNREGFLKNIKNVELEDSLSYYFVFIKDYRLKSDVAPLNFEKLNIKNIIINKRKLNLMNKIKNELYQEALLKKDIEIYDIKE
ncbi:MAG: hypothetical protein J5I47_11140 [Vicingus serpentipes]|nr:hypothetical protein [Vicingus serpentipes]